MPSNDQGRRLIVCCDGTWQNADSGYTKPTCANPVATLQVPSNVVRISRAFTHSGHDGRHQIQYYQSGVGSEGGITDKISGGVKGTGINENIRECYSFIAANYITGDQIILIGFSRGAYTARSIAGLIHAVGLLTRTGMNYFYPIWKDYVNSQNPKYKDIFPNTPFANKPIGGGADAIAEYQRRLVEGKLTRVTNKDGSPITIEAVAVWDTVGSLGVPTVGTLQKIGFPSAIHELKFYDTTLNSSIKQAFHALALDEHRGPFTPALWERRPEDKSTNDLRQVWFPGAHSNVGGGYDDQEMANVCMAWMMDQLASIGVTFKSDAINTIFQQSVQYYGHPPKERKSTSSCYAHAWKRWAVEKVYQKHRPVRPWGLGKIYDSFSAVYTITGSKIRSPGLYTRADPSSGEPTKIPLSNTNERIHSSVRLRFALGGLDQDDKGIYKCPALKKNGPWKLTKMKLKVFDPIPQDADWAPAGNEDGDGNLADADADATRAAHDLDMGEKRWVWEFDGPEKKAPEVTLLIEETLGPYERQLLILNTGMLQTVAEQAKEESVPGA